MSRCVDIVSRDVLIDFIRTSSTLPYAKIRDFRMRPNAHNELTKLIMRLFLSGSQASQVVVFSAVEPGGGCTFICTRTAEILANQLEESVCLVDANFRSPGLKHHFEFKNEARARWDGDWILMPVGADCMEAKISNFQLALHRPGPADEHRRLATVERFQTLLQDLRKEFSYIIIDAAPLSEYTDATRFARLANGLVMVLEANDTRRETAQKAKELLDASNVPVIGAVLNKRTFPIPELVYRRL
jgi:succinoglycan biosynthesis transport protein ExoP